MFNLNFASNENWSGAKASWYYLWRPKTWHNSLAKKELRMLLAKDFSVETNQVFFTLAARSLLYLFLKNLDLAEKTEVLVQAFTCEAVVLPIIEAGLTPVYVDIEAETWSMNLADLKNKVSDKTRVLILQHTFGMLPKNRTKILAWASENKIIVIEDLAHGFAPTLLDAKEKTHKLLSFGRSKFFSSVHGGALILADKDLEQKMKMSVDALSKAANELIKRALLYKLLAPVIKSSYAWGGKILHALLIKSKTFSREISELERAGNYDSWLDKQLPGVFAVLCLSQIKNYLVEYERRERIAQFYQSELKDNLLVKQLPVLRYPILVSNPDEILLKLADRGYILGDWYRQVVAPVGLNLVKVKYQLGSCPVAEDLSQRVINLPLSVSLNLAKQIMSNLKEIFDAS